MVQAGIAVARHLGRRALTSAPGVRQSQTSWTSIMHQADSVVLWANHLSKSTGYFKNGTAS